MKKFKWLATTAIAAVLMAGCGGGGGEASSNKVGFNSIVTFGDSLSDAGTYAVVGIAAPAAVGGGAGGRYTVNSGTATPTKIWLDYISSQLGLPAPCAAVTGLDGDPNFGLSSMPPAKPASCTNYAQGGSRVTNPIGPGNKNVPGNALLGQLTYPLVTQVADHLARPANAGAFNPKALVTVMAGGNDVFMQGGAAQAIGTASFSGAAQLAGWTGAQLLALNTAATGSNPAVDVPLAIQSIVGQNMAKAGTELAALIKTEIVGKGAKYVLVVNLPNVGATPNGVAGGAQAAQLSTGMAQAFNQALAAGLAGTPGVVIADAFTTSTDQFNNPSAYGLSNVRDRACKFVTGNATNTSGNILRGASLTCNPTNVIDGDISRYGFADDVHPTPYGHQLLAQFTAKVLAAAGWL
jgi:outer membrane lipase/esterase